MAKVVLVGAGPGDAGLLTLRGREAIAQADCIVYDRLIGSDILRFAAPDCEMIYAGKENHHHVLRQEEINELLYQMALVHKSVVRVKGGDPYVFGRGGEEALYLKERGVDVEVVPGVSSFIAALTDAGIPITHRAVSRGFQVMTAHSQEDKPLDIDYSELLNPEKTCVFMMGLSHTGEIAQSLMAAGRDPKTPAAVISDGTRYNQRKCIGTLENIAQKAAEEKMSSPAVIVVGDVVNLNEDLAFFENRPLFGKRYFVPYIEGFRYSFGAGIETVGESGLMDQLRAQGAGVIGCKVGKIQPVPCDVGLCRELEEKDWLVFTSRNGVHAFMWNLARQGLDLRTMGRAGIAAVGRKTAEALLDFGLKADLICEGETGGDLGRKIAEQAQPQTKVVWFCAEKTGHGFENALGGKVQLTKQICYRNVAVDAELSEKTAAAVAECDGAVFTSASNAERGYHAVDGKLPGRNYSIGPECSKKLMALQVRGIVETEDKSYEGLICRIRAEERI